MFKGIWLLIPALSSRIALHNSFDDWLFCTCLNILFGSMSSNPSSFSILFYLPKNDILFFFLFGVRLPLDLHLANWALLALFWITLLSFVDSSFIANILSNTQLSTWEGMMSYKTRMMQKSVKMARTKKKNLQLLNILYINFRFLFLSWLKK